MDDYLRTHAAFIKQVSDESVKLTGNQTIAGTKTFSSAPVVPGLSDSGNLTFTGTGNRITGDFSNATVANRVMFQTSTVNGATSISVIPNGTSTTAAVNAVNNSDPTNASITQLQTSSSESILSANRTGTGTFLPMTFHTGGSERMRIDTGGNVGIGVTPAYRLDAVANTDAIGANLRGRASDGISVIRFADNANTETCRIDARTAECRITPAGSNPVLFTNTGGFGYGTGAGGTVTQGTSRTTGVTLNRPTGSITLVSAAGTTTWQSFTVTNSIVAATDTILVNQRSGTDLYEIEVTAVAAGSFRISFRTTGGTTTEQPVFNFTVIKGATS